MYCGFTGTVREETGEYKAKSGFGNNSLIKLWMDIADIDIDMYFNVRFLSCIQQLQELTGIGQSVRQSESHTFLSQP